MPKKSLLLEELAAMLGFKKCLKKWLNLGRKKNNNLFLETQKN